MEGRQKLSRGRQRFLGYPIVSPITSTSHFVIPVGVPAHDLQTLFYFIPPLCYSVLRAFVPWALVRRSVMSIAIPNGTRKNGT